jgi:TetR/AcrR family transcriptional regulator
LEERHAELDRVIEKKIIRAASVVFARKGLDGARMQEIADEAGLNRTLLNYYFRSKERLFETIFSEFATNFLSQTQAIIEMDAPVIEKTRNFIESYLAVLQGNPFLPAFIAYELNRNPERLFKLFRPHQVNIEKLRQDIQREQECGILRAFSLEQVLVSIIGMIAYPFIAQSIIREFVCEGESCQYNKFLAERKNVILEMVERFLLVNP